MTDRSGRLAGLGREFARQAAALALMAAVLVVLLALTFPYQVAIGCLVSLLALREAWRFTGSTAGAKAGTLTGIGLGVLLGGVALAGSPSFAAFAYAGLLVVSTAVAIFIHRHRRNGISFSGAIAASLLSMAPLTWLGWLLSSGGSGRLALVIWATWAGDGGASLLGLYKGKPLPIVWAWVSPRKSWIGIGIGAVFTCIFSGIFVILFSPPVKMCEIVTLILLVPVLGPIGDFMESALKRMAELGNSGSVSILPGHGGILDRLDSLSLTVPVVIGLWEVSAR